MSTELVIMELCQQSLTTLLSKMEQQQQDVLNNTPPLDESQISLPPEEVSEPLVVEQTTVEQKEQQPKAPLSAKKAKKSASAQDPLVEDISGLTAMRSTLGWQQPDNLIATLNEPDYPYLEDTAYHPGHQAPTNYTAWLRYDDFCPYTRCFHLDAGPVQNSKVRGTYHYYDSCELANYSGPKLTIPDGWIKELSNDIIQDPNNIRSTIINPVAISKSFVQYMVQNIRNEAVPDETSWFFRHLALLWAIPGIQITSTPSFTRPWEWTSSTIEAGEQVNIRYDLRPVYGPEDNQFPPASYDIPVYYVTSAQLSVFTRNQVHGRGGFTVDDLGTNVAVVPLNNGDIGKFLIYLIAAALDSRTWQIYNGNVGIIHSAVDTPCSVLSIGYSKASKVHIPGPASAVLLVLPTEAGSSEPTPPRDFGCFGGREVPCLLDLDDQVQDISFWNEFHNFMGHTTQIGAPAGADAAVETAWLESYHWLQDHMATPGAESRAQAMAAEMFFETRLVPQPMRRPANINEYEGRPPIINRIHNRAGGRAAIRAAMRRGGVVDIVDAPEPHAGVVFSWSFEDGVRAAAGQCLRISNAHLPTLAVQHALRDYVTDVDPYDDHQLRPGLSDGLAYDVLRCSPGGFLRGSKQRAGISGVERVGLPPEWNQYQMNPADFAVPDVMVHSLRRMKVPRSNWLTRIATFFRVIPNMGRVMNWNSAAAPVEYLRSLACVMGAYLSATLVSVGLSWSVWLGLQNCVIRDGSEGPNAAIYDFFRSITFGDSVPGQLSLMGGAVARDIQQFPWYLVPDGDLNKYTTIPAVYREVCVLVDKFLDRTVCPFGASDYSWRYINWMNTRVGGWTSDRVTARYLTATLMLSHLQIGEYLPTYRHSLPGNNVLVEQVPGFMPDYAMNVKSVEIFDGAVGDLANYATNPLCAYMFVHPILENDASNTPDMLQLRNPVIRPGEQHFTSTVVVPDPQWWDWLKERAVGVGKELLKGNWIGAIANGIRYMVQDIRTHIRTRRPAWESYTGQTVGGGANQAGGQEG